EAVDKLDPFKRATPTNRELMAQGVGNIAAGLLGGLPITAVIVRGSANVQAGGRTRGSAFFHGVWLLVAVVAVPFVMNLIPLAALAAVLLYVGYKLAPFSLFHDMIQKRPIELAAPFIVTIFGVLFTDLLKGVGAGMIVAVFFILRTNLKVSYFIHHQESHEIHKKKFIRIELSENVSFLNKASVSKVLHELPEDALVEIDGTSAHHIHPDVLELIYDFADTAHTRGIEPLLTNLPEADPSEPMH
ncbi:MAG: SulP family inorganic anion transporter, partial [Deltaproteobacteria bacterium]|nr:SulP family inorganic anion transporter [Deltaproteobacteria bacterium]